MDWGKVAGFEGRNAAGDGRKVRGSGHGILAIIARLQCSVAVLCHSADKSKEYPSPFQIG